MRLRRTSLHLPTSTDAAARAKPLEPGRVSWLPHLACGVLVVYVSGCTANATLLPTLSTRCIFLPFHRESPELHLNHHRIASFRARDMNACLWLTNVSHTPRFFVHCLVVAPPPSPPGGSHAAFFPLPRYFEGVCFPPASLLLSFPRFMTRNTICAHRPSHPPRE